MARCYNDPKRVGEQNKRAPNTRMGAAYLARKAFVEAKETIVGAEQKLAAATERLGGLDALAHRIPDQKRAANSPTPNTW